jgi:hypothetical protein
MSGNERRRGQVPMLPAASCRAVQARALLSCYFHGPIEISIPMKKMQDTQMKMIREWMGGTTVKPKKP